MKRLAIGCAVAALVVLSPRSEARPPAAATVLLAASLRPAFQVGIASWYGPELQGSPTANGEQFDMNGLTAAHRELPIGARVRVTNLLNKRSITLRINDRGPSIPGRVLDVSMAAAGKLGFLRSGLALVQIEVVGRPALKRQNVAIESPAAMPAAF
jgi:rare lipoprotein A